MSKLWTDDQIQKHFIYQVVVRLERRQRGWARGGGHTPWTQWVEETHLNAYHATLKLAQARADDMTERYRPLDDQFMQTRNYTATVERI